MKHWLRVERQTTNNGGHNRILDNYKKYREQYLPNAQGEYVGKVPGHYSRFKRLMDRRSSEHPLWLPAPYNDDDSYVARIGHHALMFFNGAERARSNALSANQREFNTTHIGILGRVAFPSPVSLVEAVEKGFAKAREFERDEEVEGIWDYGTEINNTIYAAFDRAQEELTKSDAQPGIAVPLNHPFVLEMDAVQRDAIAFTAAHFAVAASLRQDAARQDAKYKLVPIMQPDSITVVGRMEFVDILSPTMPQYTFKQTPGWEEY